MPDYRADILEAVQAVQIHGSVSFSWFGAQSVQVPDDVRASMSKEAAASYLQYALKMRLYTDFYCRGKAGATVGEMFAADARPDPGFLSILEGNNAGTGCWEPGWTVLSRNQDDVVATRNGLTVIAGISTHCQGENGSYDPGDTVSLRFPSALPGISPGFYLVQGEIPLRNDDSGPLFRLYFNLMPEGAPILIRLVTENFNIAGLAYKLKTLSNPRTYYRRDSAVLYLRQSDIDDALKLIQQQFDDIEVLLKDGVPALTLEIAKGIACAEDPDDGDSFGLSRCRLIAVGIIEAWSAGGGSERALEAIEKNFTAAGVDIDRPYSCAHTDWHQRRLPSLEPPACPRPRRDTGRVVAPSPLDVAARIGDHIVKTAIWHENRCSWMGTSPVRGSGPGGTPGASFQSLGPDINSGTAGVAVFLAQLYQATDSARHLRTAVGAARHAAHLHATTEPGERLSLYTGAIGVALATGLVAITADNDELLEASENVIQDVNRDPLESVEFDLLTGLAGGCAGLTALQALPHGGAALELARTLGERVVDAGTASNGMRTWPAVNNVIISPLTGFSHGAAGIAFGLMQLHRATGEARYLEVAEQAIAYEKSVFDEGAGNWPDFRGSENQERPTSRPHGVSWCHGAPGIAVSRVEAWQNTRKREYLSEARVAAQTTSRILRSWLDSGTSNYSLCHGVAGNAEVLRFVAEIVATDEASELESLVWEAADWGARNYEGGTWPCGVGGGSTPSLLVGLSGTGQFYLRLHDSTIGSVLRPKTDFIL